MTKALDNFRIETRWGKFIHFAAATSTPP